WPNSSDSNSSDGSAATLTARNGASRRALLAWIPRASTSLPLPLSPRITREASVRATVAARSITARIAALPATPREQKRIPATGSVALQSLQRAPRSKGFSQVLIRLFLSVPFRNATWGHPPSNPVPERVWHWPCTTGRRASQGVVMKTIRILAGTLILAAAAAVLWPRGTTAGIASARAAAPNALEQSMQARDLTPDEAAAALKTFVPPGKYDDFVMVTSGGHRGTVMLYGIPSMRLLKEIPVYSADSWQGWAQGESESGEILKKGSFGGGLPTLTWGDLHHPQISLTNGKYDGEWLAVSDKSAGRVGIISMKDLKTKLIFKTPNTVSDHHAVFTDDSDWLVQSAYFPMPYMEKNGYAPIEQFKDKFRGSASFLKFDRKSGTIDVSKSFQIELPPYFQDMSILGRGPSEGLLFINSMDTELATGGDLENPKRPPLEIGASLREMDYLHVIDWKKALELVQAGKAKTINGIRVLPLGVAAAEGVIHFVPESKSPHGVDLAPG